MGSLAPAQRSPDGWERYAWGAGIVYVVALVGGSVVGVTGSVLSQNDTAAKIAAGL
jgi:hypothetical protein